MFQHNFEFLIQNTKKKYLFQSTNTYLKLKEHL